MAKTGGLADVVGALPSALRSFGDDVAVVIPRYGSIDLKTARRVYDNLPVHLGADSLRHVHLPGRRQSSRSTWSIARRSSTARASTAKPAWTTPTTTSASPSSRRAALGVARVLFRTDIFHCHDWQAGLVPAYLRTTFATDPTFLGVQDPVHHPQPRLSGPVPADRARRGRPRPRPSTGPTAWSFSARSATSRAASQFADALNTVSPTYAREIQTPEYGFGLDGALRARAAVLTGILNGVDYGEWSPDVDPLHPGPLLGRRPERQGGLQAAAACRNSACRRRPWTGPLLGIVSRFTRQKGTDLIAEVAAQIVAEDVYLVALGTGDPEYEEFFRRMAAEYPGPHRGAHRLR